MKNIREIIGENLSELRKEAKLTQLELAEKFNYSDKSISKWEKGETLPDIVTLNELCEFYGVTLDYLTHEATQENKKKYKKESSRDHYNKIILTALLVSVIWMIATIIYVWSLIKFNNGIWMAFVWAAPATFLFLTFENHRHFHPKSLYFAFFFFFLWSTLAASFLQSLNDRVWTIFLLGIPIQAALFLYGKMKH